MQKLNGVTEAERQAIKELYSVRAVPEHKISRALKDEFGINLSTTKVQRVIFRFSAEVRRKRKAVLKERLSKARRRALEKYGKENKAWAKKLKNPVVVDYSPETHGIPLWRGEPGHNQNVVKKCIVCGRLFHPYIGWEKDEVYCSFSCQAKD